MLRLLNRPPENSRLCPNLVTEYSFGDSPLIVTSPSLLFNTPQVKTRHCIKPRLDLMQGQRWVPAATRAVV
jgi:hypothetical protein